MAIDKILRRNSANYKPNIWEYSFLQSLSTQYDYRSLAGKLKEEVKLVFHDATDLTAKLELVDTTSKLGLASFFEEEIKEALDFVALTVRDRNRSFGVLREDLYLCALSFRLLRQHGYRVSQDMFSEFVDETRSFVDSKCVEDVKGLLELFEASHLETEMEDILEKASRFSARILKTKYLNLCQVDKTLARIVAHALELPVHWRVEWFDVKWQISANEKGKNVHKSLIALAKVNFNVVQSGLQKDLKHMSRWWKDLGLIEKLDFTRDRVVESFLCVVGLTVERERANFRKHLTKVVIMILILDDVYDVYGSLDELEQFTVAVDKWDEKEAGNLPGCIKTCFQSLREITHEISSEIEIEKGGNQLNQVHLHLQRVWGDFCKAMLVEAKWYRDGETPSLEEYLRNGVVSSCGTVLAVHAFYIVMDGETTGEMEGFMENDHNLIHNVCLILRLCNDLGTSEAEEERGDRKTSSIACYMKEANVSEEKARVHIKGMISKIWKKINGQCFDRLHQPFMDISINMARVVHNLYQHGDGFNGGQDRKQILSLLVHPLEL